jgi:hypothetical protein
LLGPQRRIGGLTAGQFAIFDSMLPAMGIGKYSHSIK